jgi:hypothetical protein
LATATPPRKVQRDGFKSQAAGAIQPDEKPEPDQDSNVAAPPDSRNAARRQTHEQEDGAEKCVGQIQPQRCGNRAQRSHHNKLAIKGSAAPGM